VAGAYEALLLVAQQLEKGPRGRAEARIGLRLVATLPADPQLAGVRRRIERSFRARSR